VNDAMLQTQCRHYNGVCRLLHKPQQECSIEPNLWLEDYEETNGLRAPSRGWESSQEGSQRLG
jgi:hypothetical protein